MDTFLEEALKEVETEATTLLDKYSWKPYNSWHEAYAVIQEELDEFWDCVKTNNEEGMGEELIQVAATALLGLWLWKIRKEMKCPTLRETGSTKLK